MKKYRRILTFAICLIFVLLALASCDWLTELMTKPVFEGDGHTHTYDAWSYDETEHWRTCTECGERKEAGSHSAVIDSEIPATCNKAGLSEGAHCAICDYVITAQETVAATGQHTTVPCGVTAPAFDSPGCLSGLQCTVCHTVTTGEQLLPAFRDTCATYAYQALADKTNGAGMQAFYTRLYNACVEFHNTETMNASKKDSAWIAFQVNFSECGISGDDAFLVLESLQADCPLFYWIDTRSSHNGSSLSVCTLADYANGRDRAAYNQIIYDGIVAFGNPDGSVYERVFFLHDKIVDDMTYAYKSDGTTPETDLWAHSILGYFTKSRGVCETYSETCSMILNYWGIENMIVTGEAGGVNHAWNLIQMDNGEWYWFDLTWDDQPTTPIGRIYDYFCKTDNAFAGRTISTKLFAIPARGNTAFTGDIPAVGTEIHTNTPLSNLTFTVVGYEEAELTAAEGTGSVTIPTQITYRGHTYSVVSVGNVTNNKLTPVFADGITSVNLPATVRIIHGNAMSCYSLTHVAISDENPYLFVDNGNAIYQKDPCTLLAYLSFIKQETLTLHAGTVSIATFAILNDYVKTIVLPASLKTIEANAIYSCSALVKLVYNGTTAMWQTVQKEDTLPDISIECSNGTI